MKYTNTLGVVLHLYGPRMAYAYSTFELNEDELQEKQVKHLIASKQIVVAKENTLEEDEEKFNLTPILQQIEQAAIATVVQDISTDVIDREINNALDNIVPSSKVVEEKTEPVEETAKASTEDKPNLAEKEDDSTSKPAPAPSDKKKPDSTSKK